jgi:hypothetical protein
MPGESSSELSGPAHPATAVVGGQRRAWKTKRSVVSASRTRLRRGRQALSGATVPPAGRWRGHLSDAATVTADGRPTEVGRWSLAPLRALQLGGWYRSREGAAPWPCPRRRRRDDRGLSLPQSWGSPVWPWRCSRAMVTARAIPPPRPRPPLSRPAPGASSIERPATTQPPATTAAPTTTPAVDGAATPEEVAQARYGNAYIGDCASAPEAGGQTPGSQCSISVSVGDNQVAVLVGPPNSEFIEALLVGRGDSSWALVDTYSSRRWV